LLAGTNNIGSTPASDAKAEDVVKGIKALLDTLRDKAPKATIILMGILPRNDGAKSTALVASIDKINEKIAKLADGKSIRYLNINDKLADKDGKLLEGMSQDRLHLSVKGYQVWADALKPLLTELLGPPAKEDNAPPPTGDPSAKKKASDKTAALLPPRFIAFAWRYHSGRLCSCLRCGPTPTAGLGVSGLAPPLPRLVEMEATETSQVPGEPLRAYAVFLDPGRLATGSPSPAATRPPLIQRRRLPRAVISGLDSTAWTPAAYAS
jgi:hypothetical protein